MLSAPARGDRPATTHADGEPRLRSSPCVPRRPDGRGSAPARAGNRHARDLFAEGLHSADDALPRRLRLLHVRAAAATRRARVPHRGRGARDRARGWGGRLHRGALHARRPARGALPGRRGRSSRRSGATTTLEYLARCARPRARRDRAASAPEPRRHVPRGACGAAARRRVDGDHARDDRRAARRARRPALGLAGQGARPASRDDTARGRACDPVHERDPRSGSARRGRSGSRRSLALRELADAARAPGRGDRPELPREARDADGGASRRDVRGAPLVDRRCADRPRAGRPRPGAARTSPTTTSRSFSTPGSTTGAASRP